MNIQLKTQGVAALRPLTGKVSLVTGSTSGTPLVEAQIDSQARAHGISREKVIHDVLLAQQPNKHFALGRGIGCADGLSRQRRGSVDHRHGIAGRWRLDCALAPPRRSKGA
jgi:hypothetical protein